MKVVLSIEAEEAAPELRHLLWWRTIVSLGLIWRLSQGSSLILRQITAPHFLCLSNVREMTGLITSTIYRWMTEGTFPKQIQLGSRAVVWNEQEFTKWIEERMASR